MHGGTDHTDEVRKKQPIVISSIPPLFILESVSSKWGVWNMDTLTHALIFGMIPTS